MKKLDRTASAALWGALALVALVTGGCSKELDKTFLPNQEPSIRLTHAPVDTKDPYFYAYRMNWVGFDPDGKVDHYLFAVDPVSVDFVDTTWQQTVRNEQIIFFRASVPPDSVGASGTVRATDPHVFAVRAVDDKGAMSMPVWRAFFSYNLAPTVNIETPRPSASFDPIVTPSVRITWRGRDPDGQFSQKPVKYKFRLFPVRNPDFPSIPDFIKFTLANPDSFRKLYAPGFGPSEHCPTCTSWDSSSADTTETQFTNLIPNSEYLFIVTGFDEAGAYDPVFSSGTNMLKFVVTYAGTLGPQITMYNDFFNYTYPTGGYANDPTRYFNVEVPADQKVTFNWFALPPEGASMRRYRWVMSSPDHPFDDLSDESQRFPSEETDWYHWSSYSLNTTTATVGPFTKNGENHLFFIEAEDNNGLRSLGIIRFTIVRPTFENELLFVDDTRLSPDQVLPGGILDNPRGEWPTSAELDTFLYARGGFKWRGYPDGTITTPGIFAGYSFDTVGTRGIQNGLVPLSVLGRYKHVVWYTDAQGATFIGTPYDPLVPISSLRLMSSPGQPSTVSTYLKQGGSVWLMGGGSAYATLVAWNKRGTTPNEYSDVDLELVPGRLMYDFTHWRSKVTMNPVIQANRADPYFNSSTGETVPLAPGRNWPGQPDYSKLPTQLRPRSTSTDPPPPLRGFDSQWYQTFYLGEYVSELNYIREDPDQNPDTPGEESELDTLYYGVGNSAGNPAFGASVKPVMTYYHGFENPAKGKTRSQMIFSGFPLWYFRRSQQIPLADFVLQDIWGLPREPISRQPMAPSARASRAPRN